MQKLRLILLVFRTFGVVTPSLGHLRRMTASSVSTRRDGPDGTFVGSNGRVVQKVWLFVA